MAARFGRGKHIAVSGQHILWPGLRGVQQAHGAIASSTAPSRAASAICRVPPVMEANTINRVLRAAMVLTGCALRDSGSGAFTLGLALHQHPYRLSGRQLAIQQRHHGVG